MAIWTKEMDDTLERLWADGYSASQISFRLDRAGLASKSRNAVIGRIHRLKLPPRANKRAATQPKAARPLRAPNPKWDRPEKPITVPVADVARKTLMELNDHGIGHPAHECRFPVGEPTQGFCALPAVPGLSYCEGHAQRCSALTRKLYPSLITQPPRNFNGGLERIIRSDVYRAMAVEEFTDSTVA